MMHFILLLGIVEDDSSFDRFWLYDIYTPSISYVNIQSTFKNKGYVLTWLLSKYGQIQLKKSIFGGVIDHLEVDHIKEILIPIPDKIIQNKIGSLSLLAYQKRDEANTLENELVNKLNEKILHFS